MNKKAIAILGAIFILIVGTLGYLIYAKYAGNKSSNPPAQTQNSASSTAGNLNNPFSAATTTTGSLGGGAVKLTSDQVVSPVLFYNGSGVTYFDQLGSLYQSAFDFSSGTLQLGGKKTLSIPAKANIKKILWPRKGDNFIAETADAAGKTIFSFYNSQTGAYMDLPARVYSLDWMPGGDKIFYVWSNSDPAAHDFVEIANPDTSGFQKIGEIWDKNAVVSVSPDGNSILYYRDNNSASINPIGLTTPDGKVWKSLVKSGYNFGVLWSPDSQKFLFGKRDSGGATQLWYYNIATEEVKNLGFFTTVDKAIWDLDSQTVYLAAPAAAGAGTSGDVFYRLNTSTLDKKSYSAGSNLAGYDLFLNSTSDKLFFRNALDGGLYYLDLSK